MAERARGTEALMMAGLNLIQQALSIYDSDLRLAACNRRFQEMFDLPQWLVEPGASFEDTIRHLVTHTSGIRNPIPLRWVHVTREHASFDEAAALAPCVRIVVAWSGRGCWVRSSRRRA
jgi:PAS domain-containing protein